MRQSGYGFVHFPGTEEGIRSAFIAAQRLMDTEIDNVNYKCKISHHLEQHLVPPVVQQKQIFHPSVPSSLHRTVETNRGVQMGQPHPILTDNHQMYHQPHHPNLMRQQSYPTSLPFPASAMDEFGNTTHSSARMRHEQFRLHPTSTLDLPTNPERIPSAMSNNMRQGFVSQPSYTKANQFQHPAISRNAFNPNSSVSLMNSNLTTGGASLDLLTQNFNRVTIEQNAMVPPHVAQSTGRPNTLTHDILGSSSTTSSISSISREPYGEAGVRSSPYPQFETNPAVPLNAFNFAQKTPSTLENRLFADRNNT